MSSHENLKRIRFLESERLFLTPMSMVDIDDHYRWEHDPELQYLDGQPLKPKSIEQLHADFEDALKNKNSMWFSIVASDSGRLMGVIMLFRIDMVERKAFWGIKLDGAFWRQGYGAEAAELLLRYAFETLRLRRLRSGTHSGNTASQKLQEKLGFVREGVLRAEFTLDGRPHDDMLYGMLKEDYDAIYGPQ